MPAESRENPLLKKGNSDAFFKEKYLTKNKFCQLALAVVGISALCPVGELLLRQPSKGVITVGDDPVPFPHLRKPYLFIVSVGYGPSVRIGDACPLPALSIGIGYLPAVRVLYGCRPSQGVRRDLRLSQPVLHKGQLEQDVSHFLYLPLQIPSLMADPAGPPFPVPLHNPCQSVSFFMNFPVNPFSAIIIFSPLRETI